MDITCARDHSVRTPRRTSRRAADRASMEAAIELVGAGLARRIVLCGLAHGERLLPFVANRAAALGVRVSVDRSGPGVPSIEVRRPAT